MNDRPTPETDVKACPHIGFYSCATVPADFARRLERERDEARDTIVDVLSALKPMHNEGPRLAALRVKEERDEALDAVEKSKAFKRVMKEDNAKLRRDLDKAQRDADTFLENFGKAQERAINAERELDELDKRLIEVSQFGVVAAIEREDLRKEVAAERALADRLASVMFGCTARDMNDAYDAWKEARK